MLDCEREVRKSLKQQSKRVELHQKRGHGYERERSEVSKKQKDPDNELLLRTVKEVRKTLSNKARGSNSPRSETEAQKGSSEDLKGEEDPDNE